MSTNRFIPGAIAAISLLVATQVQAQPATAESRQNVFSITAVGEARGRPDVMRIELVSESTADSVADALRQCKEKADAAVKAIEAIRIPDSQVTREMYEFSSPVTDPVSSLRRSTAAEGTRVSQVLRVEVKINEKAKPENLAETVSRVFDTAKKNGVGMRESSRRESILGETRPAVTYVLQDAGPLANQAISSAFQRADEIRKSLVASGAAPGKLVAVDSQQTEELTLVRRLSLGSDMLDRKSAISTSPEVVIVRRSLVFRYVPERAAGK